MAAVITESGGARGADLSLLFKGVGSSPLERGAAPEGLSLGEVMAHKAVVVGNGFVGRANGDVFRINHRFDVDPKRTEPPNFSLKEAASRPLVFIAVPSPESSDGSVDTSYVHAAIEGINQFPEPEEGRHIFVRSTLTPSFYRSLGDDGRNVVCNPEFLRQFRAKEEAANPPAIVIGSHPAAPETGIVLRTLYEMRFRSDQYPDINWVETDQATASLIKYASNVWLTTAVLVNNAGYDGAVDLGADPAEVIAAMRERSWGPPDSHSQVFYRDPNTFNAPVLRGARGACLPKDTSALWAEMPESPVKDVMRALIRYNNHLLRQEIPQEENNGHHQPDNYSDSATTAMIELANGLWLNTAELIKKIVYDAANKTGADSDVVYDVLTKLPWGPYRIPTNTDARQGADGAKISRALYDRMQASPAKEFVGSMNNYLSQDIPQKEHS
jgi:hypothetical protein